MLSSGVTENRSTYCLEFFDFLPYYLPSRVDVSMYSLIEISISHSGLGHLPYALNINIEDLES